MSPFRSSSNSYRTRTVLFPEQLKHKYHASNTFSSIVQIHHIPLVILRFIHPKHIVNNLHIYSLTIHMSSLCLFSRENLLHRLITSRFVIVLQLCTCIVQRISYPFCLFQWKNVGSITGGDLEDGPEEEVRYSIPTCFRRFSSSPGPCSPFASATSMRRFNLKLIK